MIHTSLPTGLGALDAPAHPLPGRQEPGVAHQHAVHQLLHADRAARGEGGWVVGRLRRLGRLGRQGRRQITMSWQEVLLNMCACD